MKTLDEMKSMTTQELIESVASCRHDAAYLENTSKEYGQIGKTWMAEKVEAKRQNILAMAAAFSQELDSRSKQFGGRGWRNENG